MTSGPLDTAHLPAATRARLTEAYRALLKRAEGWPKAYVVRAYVLARHLTVDRPELAIAQVRFGTADLGAGGWAWIAEDVARLDRLEREISAEAAR